MGVRQTQAVNVHYRADRISVAAGSGRLQPVRNPENRLSERLLLVKADARYWGTGNLALKSLLYAREQTLG